jgi:phage N-6-adenine-methyltransferase
MVRKSVNNEKDVWQTPDELLDLIKDNIDLDPCAADNTEIGDTNYTEDDDGLAQDWFGTVFVNPPFTNKVGFLEKVVEQNEAGNTDVIFVVTPDSTDVKSWWHSYIAPNTTYIWFSRGRINYINPVAQAGDPKRYGPTWGTALSIFGTPSNETLQALHDNGHIVKTVHTI